VEPGLESRSMVGVALRRTLEDHRFVRLASARTISVLGNCFSRVALAFGVLSLPDATPARLAIVLACQRLSVLEKLRRLHRERLSGRLELAQ
jgi:hypothetical protein